MSCVSSLSLWPALTCRSGEHQAEKLRLKTKKSDESRKTTVCSSLSRGGGRSSRASSAGSQLLRDSANLQSLHAELQHPQKLNVFVSNKVEFFRIKIRETHETLRDTSWRIFCRVKKKDSFCFCRLSFVFPVPNFIKHNFSGYQCLSSNRLYQTESLQRFKLSEYFM